MDRQLKVINTFEVCWKVFKRALNVFENKSYGSF